MKGYLVPDQSIRLMISISRITIAKRYLKLEKSCKQKSSHSEIKI